MCRYFDVAELAAVDWYHLLMKDVEDLCHQQVSFSLLPNVIIGIPTLILKFHKIIKIN